MSFIPKNFTTDVSDLESTISLIFSWMSSNYPTLNPSKTEFLLLDFHCKLPKSSTHHFPSLPHNTFLPLPPPGISDLSLTLTYLFPNKFPSFIALAIITFVTSVVSATLLTLPMQLLLPLRLFTLVLTTITLFTTDSLSRKLNAFNKLKIHFNVLSPTPLNIPTLLPHFNLFIGLKWTRYSLQNNLH